MQDGFARVERRLDRIDERVDTEFTQLSQRVDKVETLIRLVRTGLSNVSLQVADVLRRATNLEHPWNTAPPTW